MKTGTRLPVVAMCQAAEVSRASYYRSLAGGKPCASRKDLDVRDQMHKIALEWPCYGSRRMKKELQARGVVVNRKLVQRLMAEDNLLCVAKRKFVVTTDSAHGLTVYPNWARSKVLRAVNQLWVADITYIRLEEEFVYLAVVLDAYSRRVIGWNRLFLGRLRSRRACLRFTGWVQYAMKEARPSTTSHRTADGWLTGCLSPGVHFSYSGGSECGLQNSC